MRSLIPLFLVAALSTASSASAFFPVEKLPQPDPDKAHFDDACAMLAAVKVAGYTDEKEPTWIKDCSHHPDGMTCVATRKFISDSLSGKDPGFNCSGPMRAAYNFSSGNVGF